MAAGHPEVVHVIHFRATPEQRLKGLRVVTERRPPQGRDSVFIHAVLFAPLPIKYSTSAEIS